MIYSVNYTDTSKEALLVNSSELNAETSLNLVGKNYVSYGEIIAENSLHLLENFAHNLPPRNPTEGQIWYNNDDKKLRLYSDSDWKIIIDSEDFGFVENVYYVSNDGSDNNTGKSPADAFSSINHAIDVISLLNVEYPTIIFIKSGIHNISNPVLIPRNTILVGDNKSTIINSENSTMDIFWVNDGVVISQMAFKNYKAPAAAIAFPPDNSAGIIKSSPLITNCINLTSTGIGVRVDGDLVSGLKSIILRGCTMQNQGGIGIHALNSGRIYSDMSYSIGCDIAALSESGGYICLNGMVTKYGNYGLIADGVSDSYTSGFVTARDDRFKNIFKIHGLDKKPIIGSVVKFITSPTNDLFFTINKVSDLYLENLDESKLHIINADMSVQDEFLRTSRNMVLQIIPLTIVESEIFMSETYPNLVYDQIRFAGDVTLLITSIIDDMVFESNYRTVTFAEKYTRENIMNETGLLLAQTINVLNFIKDFVLNELPPISTPYNRVEALFNVVIQVITNGLGSLPAVVFTNPDGVTAPVSRAKEILLANKQYLIEEGIAFINDEYPALDYNELEYRVNIEYFIESVIYNILYQGNSRVMDIAEFYNNIITNDTENEALIDMFDYVRSVAAECLLNAVVSGKNIIVAQDTSLTASNSAQVDRLNVLFFIITRLLDYGYSIDISNSEETRIDIPDTTEVTFHIPSKIHSMSQIFENVGAGIDLNTAPEYLGGVAIAENQTIAQNGGVINFISIDQAGNYKIGNGITINNTTGMIAGRVFRRNVLGMITPYMLTFGGDI